jgi:hypothetical protein
MLSDSFNGRWGIQRKNESGSLLSGDLKYTKIGIPESGFAAIFASMSIKEKGWQ